ncbi:MAG: polymer-forming cytoskeletal protein [Deltaproteobacteria bacterium]|nr:polymer-forming cytoskeletal protein [Deltaproteobacteria bacterium]
MSFVKLREDPKENEKATSQAPLHSVNGGASSSKAEVFLAKGTKVVGTLHFSGTTEIDCHVEGEINSKESLTICENAVVNAKIIGGEITVRGNVNGDIVASKRLVLKRPARVIGNISASNLSIEEGVTFEGKCAMSSSGASLAPKPTGAEKTGVAA